MLSLRQSFNKWTESTRHRQLQFNSDCTASASLQPWIRNYCRGLPGYKDLYDVTTWYRHQRIAVFLCHKTYVDRSFFSRHKTHTIRGTPPAGICQTTVFIFIRLIAFCSFLYTVTVMTVFPNPHGIILIFNTTLIRIIQTSPLAARMKGSSPALINLLNLTGYVMHQQFNIQQLYVLPTLYLGVLYLSENKQRLVPLTA